MLRRCWWENTEEDGTAAPFRRRLIIRGQVMMEEGQSRSAALVPILEPNRGLGRRVMRQYFLHCLQTQLPHPFGMTCQLG